MPRRSSRLSVEPQPQPAETLPAKRKRSQPVEVVDALEEKENLEDQKPASRSRRSSSARTSMNSSTRSKASTRTRSSMLEEVPETDDEATSDGPPPVKKKRPSLEPEEDEDDEAYEEEEEKPKARKGRKPASGRGRGRAARVTSQRRPKRTSNPSPIPSEDENGTEEDIPKPPKRSSKVSSKQSRDEDATMEDDEDLSAFEEPIRKKGKPKAPKPSQPSSSPRASGSRPEREEEEDELEDLQKPPVPEPLSVPPTSQAGQTQTQAIPEEPQGPKPRLVIHKLALVNFKSYAGRQEIGPFHRSFSSIVGANGSGKSNTIDALLFVFGYRATKMRQAKLSELIHNSARYPDLDECSVEVFFREVIDLPDDKYEVVPNSQLHVARHAYRNNGSKYTINHRQSTYADVQKLLKGRGIDLDHKRFLILQGEVESIAQMKPKGTEHDEGLLEYLEDIIGTSKYKEPIDQAMVKMEELQEERSDKLNRLRLVEKEKNALEDKKKEAEDYLRLLNQLARAQSRLYQWYIWQALINEDKFKNMIDRLEKQLNDEREKNKDDITHLEMLQEHYVEREKAYKEVQAAAIAASKELAEKEKQEVSLNEKKKHAASKVKKSKKLVQDETHAFNQARNAIEDSTEKIEKERKKLDAHEASLEEEEKVLENIVESLKGKTQVYHDQKEALQKQLQPWTEKINQKKREINVAAGERDVLKKKAEDAQDAIAEAEENLEKLRGEQQDKASRQTKLKSDKAELKKQKDQVEQQLQDARVKERDLKTKASGAHQRVQEARSSQAESRSQNKVLDGLTRLSEQGRIKGFHGRLGALGTIPDKYDVAISTACGSLHNMVVDTVEQGQACIEYLRNQNIGRASFIVLEKLNFSPNQLQKMSTPENVPRLFDLITFKDPKFAPAFYKALSDTLVAENMDQANRIAYGAKRYRVVTLAGQVIDISGTMSGGGSQPARGGMSSKLAPAAVSADTLRRFETESEDALRQHEAALQHVRNLEGELERLKNASPGIDLEFEKLGLDIETGKRRISEAEKRLRDVQSRSKPDANDVARIAALEKQLKASNAELEQIQDKTTDIESALEEVEAKIIQIGGSKLLTQKSKVEGIRTYIETANNEITKAEVAIGKAEKDMAKSKHLVETNEAALKEASEEVDRFSEQLAELQEYMSGVRERVEEAEAAEEKENSDLAELKAQLDEKMEEVETFRQTEMKLQKSLADAEKEQKDNEERMAHWQQKHDELKLEEIDDDEDDEDEGEDPEQSREQSHEQEDAEVKPDPDAPPKSRKSKTRTDELETYTEAQLSKFKQRDMQIDAQTLEEQVKLAKPNLGVLEEYKKREEEYFNRLNDVERVTQQRDDMKKSYDDLRKQRLDEFMVGFNQISLKLKEMYQMITLGGNAELELVDSMDPFSEGIIFSVMPPKKSWKNISNLSGGEKTLSSLALVFALHVFKPTPLYFMDEIDAALDFRNVSIVANYIKDRTKNAQFIIISLRNDMFELSHRLIGIYKTANATQSISIDNHALAARPVAS
ncbi:Structural maintenance of chromosomes protein 4 [Stygiomarasmius scandens]|uniref:Structural maintenance of chromosomes protein n=1 Tax=Marasmiellus scandens TaxID=2682957 RepID=A0ABR1K1Y8_9AGAR